MSDLNLEALQQRLEHVEAELNRHRTREARRLRMAGVLAVVAVVGGVLVSSRTALAAGLCTYAGLNAALIPMCPDTPAIADETNANNKQLTDWIVQKVGPVGSANHTITGTQSYGNRTAQLLNLWGTEYGIGIQSGTLYNRSSANFAWHLGGIHNDNPTNPGGGSNLMVLNGQQLLVNVPINTTSAVGATSLNVSGTATVGTLNANALNVATGLSGSLESRVATAGGVNTVSVSCSPGKRIVTAVGWTNDNNSACDVGNRQTRCQVPLVLSGCVGATSCSHSGSANGCGNPGNTCLYATCL